MVWWLTAARAAQEAAMTGIEIVCPECPTIVSVPFGFSGSGVESVRCPNCETVIWRNTQRTPVAATKSPGRFRFYPQSSSPSSPGVEEGLWREGERDEARRLLDF